MASPYQQQVRQRKLLYIGLIVVLFSAAWVWRQTVVAAQAERLAIGEVSRGEVDLTSSVIRLGLTGSRGVVTCFLWNYAIDAQKKNKWNELERAVNSLTKLQPHFITPWLFQSWNLSYNVSVESDRIRDKYFYISRGVELLGRGERQNRNHPDLRWHVGNTIQHKIYKSDETNYLRSLFQLSMIPPNDRDPARFWIQTDTGPEFNYAEFKSFLEENPQLVRRLREGMNKDTLREKKRLFEAATPDAVVRFLEENYQVPSIYKPRVLPAYVPAHARGWQRKPGRPDELLAGEERFPVLPPPRDTEKFDPDALTWEANLRDEHDGYLIAHAWFCYSQEALPLPGELPGSSVEITDRTRNRRPKHMTTLIFRNYPAQARRFHAERLQEEGWFDSEPWDASDWFQDIKDTNLAGAAVKAGGGREWSELAWRRAFRAWEDHGLENKLLFKSQGEEKRTRDLSERFARRNRLEPHTAPPPLSESDMSASDREEYQAAKYMFEYNFYRQVSHFAHHLNRSFVESKPVTVACRKLFSRADQLNLAGETVAALNTYRRPIKHPAWADSGEMSPLEAWRELVLGTKEGKGNLEFRRDYSNQETSAEIQIRYMTLLNRQDGRVLKRQLSEMAPLVPLLPRLTTDTFRAPIFQGPFDVPDYKGIPLVGDDAMDSSMDRMNLPSRRVIRETPRPTPEDQMMMGKDKGKGPPPKPQPR